jgi:2-dehydropantoate 2-reductase
MRIGIIGAGALGSVFGAYLHDSGEDVVLFDIDEDQVSAIDENGLFIERPDRDDLRVYPEVSTDPSTLGVVDVAFVFVKAFDTRQAMRDAEPLYDDETIVVTLQNGLKNMETIAEFVPDDNVVGGATTVGSATEGPGQILHTGWGKSILGGPDPERVEQVKELVEGASLETTVVDDPEPHIWRKQFVSVGIKPIAALTELVDGPLAEHDVTRSAMRKLIEEAVAVARAKDIEIFSEDPVEDAYHTCEINYETKSSMLEDVENARPTEIDHINGAIVEYGMEVGVETPHNQFVTELVKGKEHSYQ